MNPLWLAVGTLTALPVPAPSRTDRRTAGAAMLLPELAVAVTALASPRAAPGRTRRHRRRVGGRL